MTRVLALALVLVLAPVAPALASQVLRISAIPDQNPELLNRLYGLLAKELSDQLGVPVKYKPVVDYGAAVTGFRRGDLDLVWFCLLYTSPSPRDPKTSRMPSSA